MVDLAVQKVVRPLFPTCSWGGREIGHGHHGASEATYLQYDHDVSPLDT